MNFAAKPRAGEAVAKLVRADDQKIEQDDHGNRKPTGVKPGQLLAKFAPMADDHAPGHQNGDSRECYEIGRIEEARSGDQALQKLARVENLEPAIQGTAAKARRLPVRFAGSALRFQEAVLLQVLEEAVQGFHRKFPAKTNFRWKRSEEHTSELQSLTNLVCRLLLEKKKKKKKQDNKV